MSAPRRRRARGRLAAAALLLLPAAGAGAGAGGAAPAPYDAVRDLMAEERRTRQAAARELAARGDASLVPALVDAIFFTARPHRQELLETLEALTGEKREGYYEWVEYVGARADLEPAPGYLDWKVSLLERIDPNYRKIFYPGAPSDLRLEEVVWGGVPVDGIPSLDRPPVLAAAEARYLKPRERVFGVEIGGSARAYPLRFLDWHEMLNDELAGQPFTLSYCTLCGSGILYATDTPAGGAYTFGTSGLLYRSNKLMFDRQTLSLWSNLTGEPVVGRLAPAPVRLPLLPMTLTTWEEWTARHPNTEVVDLDGVRARVAVGFDYRPGAADRARRGVSYPVWLASDELERDEEIYALRVEGAPKAYPLAPLLDAGLVHDELGGVGIVLVADAESGAVRVYRRGERRFRRRAGGGLVDTDGTVWELSERALSASVGGAVIELERLPGHVAYWFGWYGFYPETEIWGRDAAAGSN